MMLQIGDQFDRYQIRSHMAQGGMADIYRAYDLMSGREVVLKVPNQMMIGDPALYERFQRELEVTNNLQHPAVQRGLGSGQYNRTPYLVTEFVEGQALRQIIEKEAPLTPERAVDLTRKIAEGMAYCHEHDVIHRDLKPENVLVSKDGQPVILDFGLALTRSARRVTYANLTPTAGTPDYMSPEQIEGQRGDARSDIYAVGIMLYEMLCGCAPYSGDTAMAVMAQHVQGNAPRADQTRPGISLTLTAIIARCMQRNPDDRYQTMRALMHDLDHLDSVDTSVLNKAPRSAAAPFWRSQAFIAVVISALVMIAIVLFALAVQGLR
ncbi:MAG: serine/threonine protein kinase [Chloroflexi bacterium]|nr:serine/threonine protein kinase [Chloroflexota bacterium]